MDQRNKTLGEYIIEKQEEFQYSSGELSRLINSIRLAAKVVNYKVNKAGPQNQSLILKKKQLLHFKAAIISAHKSIMTLLSGS